MQKRVFIDKNAEKELREFSQEVQLEFQGHFENLRTQGKIDFPDSKKIKRNLFEIRVKYEGEYRGFYAYVEKLEIIILHLFRKKTQKMPAKNLKVAERRLKNYEYKN